MEDVVRMLADRGDHAGVVRLVEAWADAGRPTRPARLAAARAFFALRLMDRATARLREILDDTPEDPEALRLLAEISLERGWPQRARGPLTTLRDAGATDLDALWERAHQEPVRPETHARVIEREGTPEQQLKLAEQFLATGSLLRATGILERLRRANPAHPRVRELLWGLAGDFSAHGLPLPALVRQLQPLVPIRLQEAADDPEHTEFTESLKEADRFLVEENPDPPDAGAFPSLFKHGTAADLLPADDPVESTQSSRLASLEEMASGGLGDVTDLGLLANAPPSGGDTQIMLVLRPGQAPKEQKEQKHRRRADPDALRETLNLKEYQAAMGMSAPAADPADVNVVDAALEPPEEDVLEDEDENVVMMTRPEPAPAVPAPAPADLRRPMEVIERHAAPPVPAMPAPSFQPEPFPFDVPPPARPPRSAVGRVFAGGFALFALGFLVLAGLLLLRGVEPRPAGISIREDLVRALAAQDYGSLLQEEGRLEQMAGGKPAADVVAALAEVRLVLWSDFNGDPARMQAVSTMLAAPVGIDAHRLAFLRAGEALAREDLSGARAALGAETPNDDEERLLVARLWAAGDDSARALELFARMNEPEAPRYRLAMADVLAGAGRLDEARASVQKVLTAHAEHVAASLALLELDRSEPPARVATADIFLTRFRNRNLAPRFEGRANVIRARAYAAMGLVGKAREAADAGLARDGTNPELLYVVAVDEAVHQHNLAAVTELSTVVDARPGDAAAQTARVLLLLELDRVDEAAASVQAMAAAQVLPDLTATLAALVDVVGYQSAPTPPLGPTADATPIGAYTVALDHARARRPEAAAAIRAAQTAVEKSGDPFLVRLSPRLVALAVTVAPAGETAALLAEAERVAADDPVAHVYLGRYFENAGRRAVAAQHFDRATELGPETGLAWYERGRFYKGAPEGLSRTEDAWRSYLALAPTGPRATRVRASLPRP